jgi:tetraacyldisaccharide 4'-kinase
MLKLFLAPFAVIYGAVIYIRNLLFDIGILPSQSFSAPIVCIGNLTVGGTGKTPHTEYLIKLLSQDYQVATLSRGYKRKSKGFILANCNSTSLDIGDEPLQMSLKFSEVTVAVDEKRVRGISQLLACKPNTEIILLDDAFQHRYVKPGLSVLLTSHNNLIYKDFFLPFGSLRDSFAQRKRANIIIITKCPNDLTLTEQNSIIQRLKVKDYQSVFFTTYTYGDIKSIFTDDTLVPSSSNQLPVMAMAGIADPKPFFSQLQNKYNVCERIEFPDHFNFTEKKIRTIFEKFSKAKGNPIAIVTTEKDAARVRGIKNLPKEIKDIFFYIPIEVEFLNGKAKDFNDKIHEYVRKGKRNNGIHQR